MKYLSESERFHGYLRLLGLQEQVARGEIGKAYLWKEKLMNSVQNTILDLAPQGTNSQQDFVEVLQKAIKAVDEELRAAAKSEAEMGDIELTLDMIERTLSMVPFQVFFSSVSRQ